MQAAVGVQGMVRLVEALAVLVEVALEARQEAVLPVLLTQAVAVVEVVTLPAAA
jgi:hypothetical protein